MHAQATIATESDSESRHSLGTARGIVHACALGVACWAYLLWLVLG